MELVPFAEQICQRRLNVHHVLVYQHDRELAHFDFKPTRRRDNVHSASKSVLSMAIGIAIDEGLLTLDARPTEVLKAHLPEELSPTWEDVTLRHLLTMTSGHRIKLLNGYSMDPTQTNRDDLPDPDWVHHIFTQAPAVRPGSLFVYNNACPYLAGRMLEERAGERLIDYLRPRLFVPMDIRNPQWLTDPLGYTCGAGGLQLTPEELMRFGRLCLHGGEWNGRQLVPSAYLRAAMSRQVSSVNEHAMKVDVVSADSPDFSAGYGYLFWRASFEGACYMYGWGSQLCVVLPALDACVVTTASEFATQQILTLIRQFIVPELKAS